MAPPVQTPSNAFTRLHGRVTSYREDIKDVRQVDLLILPPTRMVAYPVETEARFIMHRADLIDPSEWNEMDGRTVVEAHVLSLATLRDMQPLVLPHAHATPAPLPRFARLVNVLFSEASGSSGGGGMEQPQMERVLPGSRPPYNPRNFRR